MKTKKPLLLDGWAIARFPDTVDMLEYIKNFIKIEAFGGIVLMAVALLAMLLASSPLAGLYHELLHHELSLGIAPYALSKPFSHLINDGLMVLFFLVIGQEIKNECMEGELSSASKAALPLAGAFGGVVLPAIIYSLFNSGEALQGWAIPSATDIAFSLGVLSLLGARVPVALKVFLMALAVIDDLLAILIIAIFYTEAIHWQALLLAVACCAVLAAMNRYGVKRASAYLLVGGVLWLAVLSSGVHATVAGVLLGVLMPLPVGRRVGHALHPWVSYGILPLFALANAGVALDAVNGQMLAHPVALGTAVGLFAGKQLGIFTACWLAVHARIAQLPEGVSWKALYAVSAIAGIGFTMSLFIGVLAFTDASLQEHVRLGVMLGSMASAVFGSLLLIIFCRKG